MTLDKRLEAYLKDTPFGQTRSPKHYDQFPPSPCTDCKDCELTPKGRHLHFCKLRQRAVMDGQEYCDLFLRKVEA